jgi:hypothetical protein
MTSDDLRRKNAHLRDRIEQVLEKHPELRDVNEEIALRQDLHVEVGTPFLERTQGKLQERAGAIIEGRPRTRGLFRRLTGEGLPIPSPGQASDGGSAGKA